VEELGERAARRETVIRSADLTQGRIEEIGVHGSSVHWLHLPGDMLIGLTPASAAIAALGNR
jgi:hypothetical protein